jgi:hypothetical protein
MFCFADQTGETLAALLGPGNVGFFVKARRKPQVTATIFDASGIEQVWLPALDGEGEERDDAAAVVEPTCLIDAAGLPAGTRLIVRREPLHPGAQRSLFPDLGYRYWGFYTDQAGDARALDRTMRAHAHLEQHICRLKDSGLTRFPFLNFEANAAWLIMVAISADLVRILDRWPTAEVLPTAYRQIAPLS